VRRTAQANRAPEWFVTSNSRVIVTARAEDSVISNAPELNPAGVWKSSSVNWLPGRNHRPNRPASGPSQKRSSPP
jgi:hypothetical protein